jgi:type IV secretory pathway VirB2 component (pilin)
VTWQLRVAIAVIIAISWSLIFGWEAGLDVVVGVVMGLTLWTAADQIRGGRT